MMDSKTADPAFVEKLENARFEARRGRKVIVWEFEGRGFVTYSDGFTEEVRAILSNNRACAIKAAGSTPMEGKQTMQFPSGRGGKRAGAGRPPGTQSKPKANRKKPVTIMLQPHFINFLRQHARRGRSQAALIEHALEIVFNIKKKA